MASVGLRVQPPDTQRLAYLLAFQLCLECALHCFLVILSRIVTISLQHVCVGLIQTVSPLLEMFSLRRKERFCRKTHLMTAMSPLSFDSMSDGEASSRLPFHWRGWREVWILRDLIKPVGGGPTTSFQRHWCHILFIQTHHFPLELQDKIDSSLDRALDKNFLVTL